MKIIRRPNTPDEWQELFQRCISKLDTIDVPATMDYDRTNPVALNVINDAMAKAEIQRRELVSVRRTTEMLRAVMQRWHDYKHAQLMDKAMSLELADGKKTYPNVSDRKNYSILNNERFIKDLEAINLIDESISIEEKALNQYVRTLTNISHNERCMANNSGSR